MVERTVVIIKPDAVSRALNFQIMERFEKRGFKLVACRMLQATKEQAELHYGRTHGSAAFLISGPMVATLWEAHDAIAAARATTGDAEPANASLGTIRGDFAVNPTRNLLECSTDAAAAQHEMSVWFTPAELSACQTSVDPLGAVQPASAKLHPVPAAATKVPSTSASTNGTNAGKSKSQINKEAREAKKAEKRANKANGDGQSRGRGKATTNVDPAFYEPPSGTRDFFPDDMRVRNWLFGKFRETARRFAFQEYDAPVLERVELYERKAGEEITEQMYNFTDKDDKRVTLRPEMTPTLARMILSLGDRFLKPVKWFSVPQCWRFETVQRGRKREHYQWNMDIIGEASISAEAELLAAITSFFQSVGISSADVGIKVNSRRVLSTILRVYGVTDDMFERVCVIVDKLDKIGPDATVEQLVPVGVPEDAARKIVQSLSLKSIEALRELTGAEGKHAVDELVALFDIAEAYGFREWLIFDASVVRGLAYYTGVVFEGFDRRGELRAICGGGRYDRLLSLYGSTEVVPACGFGFGDCVIMELLRDKSCLPTLKPQIDFVIMAYSAEMRCGQVAVAAKLRAAGYAVDVLLEPAKKVAKAFNYADRVNGRRSLFVAPSEWLAGTVRMKDLRKHTKDGDEKEVDLPFDTLVEALTAMDIFPM